MDNLRYGCDFETADRICNFNRRFAEASGYFAKEQISWIQALKNAGDNEITYYDSVTGKPLFIAPRGRTTK